MTINRKGLVTYTAWNPRNMPPQEERWALDRVAMEERVSMPMWRSVVEGNGPAPTIPVGQVIAIRNELKGLHTAAVERARRFTEGPDSRHALADANYQEAMRAAKAAQRGIEQCDSAVETAAQLAAAAPAYGAAGSQRSDSTTGAMEVRSGADWAQVMPERDDELRSAHEAGELDIADFVRAVAGMRASDAAKRALSVGTDSAGGFSVPTVLMPGILDALVPVSALLQAGAAVIPVGEEGNGAKSYNWAAVQSVPTASWRNEAAAVAESDPVFRNVQAIPRSLAFRFKVSRELLMDGNGLAQALNRAIGAAFARELDRAGLLGTGTAPQPRGIANVAGVQAVGNGANGASLATLRWANLMTATQSILAADAPPPTAAIMAPRSLIGFGNLADTTNQPLMRPTTLDSMSFISTSAVPVNQTVGTSTDCTTIFVGDFRCVRYVMRERPSIQLLNELYAETGEVGFLAHVRADVVVTYPAQLAVITGVRP